MKKSSARSVCTLCAILAGVLSTAWVKADYQSTILADNPSGYWRLSEKPVTLADIQVTNRGSLGAAANGEFIGYVGREEAGALVGSDDWAMHFWNSPEVSRIYFGSPAAFNFTGDGKDQPFTLEIWAKPMSVPTGSQRLMSNAQGGQGYGLTFFGDDKLRFTAFGVADVNSDAAPAAFVSNQWYHVAVTRGVGNVTFYLNGKQLGAVKPLATINTTANPLTLGRTATGGEAFTGVLDEPAVYASVLSAERIAAHYYAALTNGPGYPAVILADDPIGYWRLNEPKKVQSTSVIANSGSLGAVADGAVFGAEGSVRGGLASPLSGDPDTAMEFIQVGPAYSLPMGGMISVPHHADLNTASFSVECWARLDSWANVHQSPVTSRYSAGYTNQGFILYAAPSGNLPRWEFWTGGGTVWNTVNAGGPDVVMNQWTHLVATYDDENRILALYVDGRLARGLADRLTLPSQANPLRIGAGSSEVNFGQYHWQGGVDEVAVYPGVLSPEQVIAHYRAATGNPPPVTAAPGIQQQPPADIAGWAGQPIRVSCVVTGSLPMQLQWYRVSSDNLTMTPVPNATNLILNLSSPSAAEAGYYYLTATNAAGGAESEWVNVDILSAMGPEFTLNAPAEVPVYAGGTAGIPVIASNTPPITYQWQSNTVNIAGATRSVLALPNVQPSYAGAQFRAMAANPVSSVFSDPAQLKVLTPPNFTYAAQVIRLNPLAYWRLGEASGPLAFDYWGGHPALYVGAVQGQSPGGIMADDDGAVSLWGGGAGVQTLETTPFGFSGFQNFTLTTFVKVTTPVAANTAARIFSNWQAATATNASSGFGFGLYGMTKLRFTAFGVVDLDANVASLESDKWYHLAAVRSNHLVYLYINGTLANSGTVGAIRPSVMPLQLGSNPNPGNPESISAMLDEAAVFDRALAPDEIASLYSARFGLMPPEIVKHPAPSQVFVGGTARFEVQAVGSLPLGYAWKANNVAIPGATNAWLEIPGVTLAQNGVAYSVTVANAAGNVQSHSALLTVSTPSGYPAAVVADDPVAFYRLGESAGPVVYDVWGGHAGQANDSVSFGEEGALAGDPNTAIVCDGFTSRIDVPYHPNLNPAIFSVEAWAKVMGRQGNYRALISARDEGSGFSNGFIIYATAGNNWSFWVGDGAGWRVLDGPPVALDEWTHLVATYDGETKYFYVNGELVGTQMIGYAPNTLRPLRIGAGRNEFDTPPPGDPTLYWFDGAIDEVAVYDKVLTPEQIASHYGLGLYGSDTKPFFRREPAPQSVAVGTPVVLSAEVGGSPLLQYQWYQDGALLDGATSAALVIPDAPYAANGNYELAVTNSIGGIRSAAVRLAVMPPAQFCNLTNDLVLHLAFEDNFNDSSGRGHDAVSSSPPTFVPGPLGKAVRLVTDPGSSTFNHLQVYDTATYAAHPDFQFSTDVDFSVSYWVRFTGTPGDLPFLATAWNSYGQQGLTFAPGWETGTWSYYLGAISDTGDDLGTGYNTDQINDGQWHLLVHSFDRSGNAVTYLDGVEVDVRSMVGVGDLDSYYYLTIGQDPSTAYAEAAVLEMDDVGIWRRALSAYEAQSIYTVATTAGKSFDTYGPVTLQIIPTGPELELIWQAGTLEQADEVNGQYTPVPGAVAPYYKVTPGVVRKFYRIKL
ncbi:MAG: hypothetical protein KA236_02740 [Verrucomicrobia bacterium]|nr:hypothetical protein [Verrucomicrobiota bacterium]